MRRAEIAMALATSLLVLGCAEDAPPLGSERDPRAPVKLWPVPDTGGPTQATQGGGGAAAVPPGSAEAMFDADAVYVLGQIGDPCFSKAIMDLDAPDRLMTGIDCSAKEHTAAIRTDPDLLVYVDDRRLEVRSFRCEGCTYTPADAPFFPTRLGGADSMTKYAGCTVVSDLVVGLDGQLGTKCSNGWWLPGNGTGSRRAGGELLALGAGGTALSETAIVQADGTSVRFMVPASVTGARRLRVARAHERGYWAVFERPLAAPDLCDIALDGTVVHVGTYPEIPGGTQEAARASVVLDTEGRLLELMANGRVVRRSVAGESAIVYESEMAPQFSPGALVTGP